MKNGRLAGVTGGTHGNFRAEFVLGFGFGGRALQPGVMSDVTEQLPPRVSVRTGADGLEVALSGVWRITEARPSWAECGGAQKATRVRVEMDAVEKWDSSLLLFVFEMQEACRASGGYCDVTALPAKVRTLLGQLASSHNTSVPFDRSESFLTGVGEATVDAWGKGREIVQFVGECVISGVRLVRLPHKFRWKDCIDEMQQCGAMSLPIVSLISFLVGVIMAYQAAVQLRQFGADIYVADLVGLAVVREMGPMMAAIVLAGRTGAAFAATLGNMKANEEIDALTALGISPVDFLVLPRIVALGLMMPLLALYANGVGILGGMVVAAGILEIPPTAYWIETQSIVDLSDVGTGLFKALTFGLLIGLSGCLRGLQAERSAMGVGRAATSAVVTAILLIIVANTFFAVAFNILGV
jgi:phospholipid/cholesterol/gamma-HCH transport system permease protein